MIAKSIKNILFFLKKNQHTFSPVFIIGCGRSGTTILGETLSHHSKIKYLNERRDLWHKAYPEFNIWEMNKESILFANKKNIDPKKNNLLKKLFFQEQVIADANILLEKLPINNFRLEFLKESFINAKYIYLTRNGLEVSHSIEKKIRNNQWFKGNKYLLLKKFYEKQEHSFIPKSNLEKGMWEWRMSMNESHKFFQKMNDKDYIHISYDDLIEESQVTVEKVLDFLEVPYSNNFSHEVSRKIERKNQAIIKTKNNSLMKIGGELLLKTINNTYQPI